MLSILFWKSKQTEAGLLHEFENQIVSQFVTKYTLNRKSGPCFIYLPINLFAVTTVLVGNQEYS